MERACNRTQFGSQTASPLRASIGFSPRKTSPQLIALHDAISRELASVGDLILVLIGTVKGLRPSAETVDGNAVKELRLTPSVSRQCENIDAGVYARKLILPIEDLLARINRDFEEQGGLLPEDRRQIAKAYDALLYNATSCVSIPTAKTVRPKETTLGQIVGSLRSETNEYRRGLDRNFLYRALNRPIIYTRPRLKAIARAIFRW